MHRFLAFSSQEDARWVVGIHISYALLELGLVDGGGKLHKHIRVVLSADLQEHEFSRLLVEELEQFIKGVTVSVQAIGVGCLGLVSFERGELLNTLSMGWEHIRLAEIIRAKFQLPVYVDNDVRCMTLAEMLHGSGSLSGDFLCLFIGEGIGSGLVLNGELRRGGITGAGELGHITYMPGGVDCWCGNHGCLEQYASHGAIVGEMMADSLDDVIGLYRQGNKEACRIIRAAGRAVGCVLANYINMFHIGTIVMAGRLTAAHLPLMSAVREEIARRSFLIKYEEVDIVSSALGEDIGVVGAACLAMHNEMLK
jgi:glucokinase